MAAPATEEQPGIVSERPRSPYRNKWWIASAVLVGLIAVMGLYLAVTPPAHQKHPAAPTAAAPAPASPSAAASTCGLPTGDQTPPVSAPADTTWRLVGAMAAPYDPKVAGPAVDRDGVGLCYADTPVGALYAAVNFVAASTVPQLRKPAVDLLCAAGPGRDAALAALATAPGTSSGAPPTLAGYLFTSYTPAAAATIDLAVTTGTGGWAHFPLSLVFTSGDWKVQLPATGDPFVYIQSLPTLGGYTAWQA